MDMSLVAQLQVQPKRQLGLLHMLQASAAVSDYATLMPEILRDNTRPGLPPFTAPST
jgi:hypothetical protein